MRSGFGAGGAAHEVRGAFLVELLHEVAAEAALHRSGQCRLVVEMAAYKAMEELRLPPPHLVLGEETFRTAHLPLRPSPSPTAPLLLELVADQRLPEQALKPESRLCTVCLRQARYGPKLVRRHQRPVALQEHVELPGGQARHLDELLLGGQSLLDEVRAIELHRVFELPGEVRVPHDPPHCDVHCGSPGAPRQRDTRGWAVDGGDTG
mmetsp:Transcript_123342/g.356465  ORF Transcript_123342/g.356465 Transcript_123342/m.356465 type:complete len:208 (+) Transcript_123342:413-1036(+)